jgi:transitional endoplasmic reticulum ATPase
MKMTGTQQFQGRAAMDGAAQEFIHHSSGQRVFTDTVIVDCLRKQYPELKLTVAPEPSTGLLAYVLLPKSLQFFLEGLFH